MRWQATPAIWEYRLPTSCEAWRRPRLLRTLRPASLRWQAILTVTRARHSSSQARVFRQHHERKASRQSGQRMKHSPQKRPAGGANETFERLAEPYRREMKLHCYRMMGSLHEAEDLVQETYLRAWRHFDSFQQGTSIRA